MQCISEEGTHYSGEKNVLLITETPYKTCLLLDRLDRLVNSFLA